MKIAGMDCDLPVYPINDQLSIAAFILFDHTELTVKVAEELLKKAPDFDIILTPEAKAISLAYEMSKQSGKRYIVARKGTKVYMGNPISVDVQSITTENIQHLYLGELEAEAIKGKKVLIVDDVISTGESLKSVIELCEKVGGEIVASCAVLAEGDASKRDDIIFLEPLPLL